MASADPVGPAIGSTPITVYQIPTAGIAEAGGLFALSTISGYVGEIRAASLTPGTATVAALVKPEYCAEPPWGSRWDAVVRVSFVNLTNARSGAADVPPCGDDSATLMTGRGPVLFTVSLVPGSGKSGLPIGLPGGGGFIVP